MKDRMERLVAFPFVTGCVSAASVVVCVQHGRRSKEDINPSHMSLSQSHANSNIFLSFVIPKDQKDEEGAPTSSDNMMKSSFRFTSLSKPNVSIGLQRLTKSIKSLSQSLVFKDDMEIEMEMEIGLPTDVKHVAHVGFDGSVTSEANHNGNLSASDFLGFCPISIAELEERLAMCAPLDASHNIETVRADATQARNKTEELIDVELCFEAATTTTISIIPSPVSMMKDRMERLVAFPFVTGCVSAASVAVCVQHVCRSFGIAKDQKDEEGAPTSSDNMMKSSFRFTSLSKPNVSIGLQRLTKSIKSLSQSLGRHGIGNRLPTDVKHVAHVGFDGSVTSEANHNGNLSASDFLGFCRISFAELEERLAMGAPLDASHNMETVRPDAIQARNKTEVSMA
ncbi:hypothetical protein L1987_39549 [Smallanthus sonchifolius]|uniref:Uncharacterized protein n=1 Tax=Smallanthus sonchifolius TaxID=185202 RepID=A0ACB9HNG9_9ASTR|nr:hypothetical protein L1987_39549 [Smallanthus sonchifolius]